MAAPVNPKQRKLVTGLIIIGLVIIVLFAFLFLPQIGELLKNFQPEAPF